LDENSNIGERKIIEKFVHTTYEIIGIQTNSAQR